MAVETGWMAAAETRVPDATKALAEREASMDGSTEANPKNMLAPRRLDRAGTVRRPRTVDDGAAVPADRRNLPDKALGIRQPTLTTREVAYRTPVPSGCTRTRR